MKIVFYTDIPRSFKSNLAGLLADLIKSHQVVLLTEKIGENSFPEIEKVQVNQYSPGEGLIAKNKRLANLAKNIIKEQKPDIVIATGSYFFESYLRRLAKKRGIVTISALGPFFVNNLKDFVKYRYYITAHGKGILFAKIKKLFAQFVYYWLLPLTAGQLPFIGYESSILWDPTRKKGADYYFVFSEKDKQVLKNSGADIGNVFVLTHPLADPFTKESNEKIITIMEDGKPYLVNRNDFSLISEEKRREYKKEVVKTVAEILNDWKIYVKPHPKDNDKRVKQMREDFAGLAKVVGPGESAEDYIKKSYITLDYVAGMAVFSAVLMNRLVISVDWQEEFMADFYKDSDAVEYVDTREKLIFILKGIKAGDYKKEKKELKKQGFSSMLDLLEFIKNEHRK
ncbi:hypothetical protein AMJ47_00340 [Parcubacteria bacterium DG_72]|nr:MAG: hypothetical protein AMJ47_00340 [Parcubacteria bacterium DG_72]